LKYVERFLASEIEAEIPLFKLLSKHNLQAEKLRSNISERA
jgi:hypothetical protein